MQETIGFLTLELLLAAEAGFSSALALSLSGAPAGVTASLSKTSIAAPGTGTLTLNTAVAATATPGKYALVITGQGGGQTQYSGVPIGMTVKPSGPLYGNESIVTLSIYVPQTTAAGTYNMAGTASAAGGFSSTATFSVVVTANSFTAKPSATTVTVVPGASAPLSVSTAHQGVFNSGVTLAWWGLPSGVTATLAKSSLSAPGDGTVVTTFAASSVATPGTYTPTLTATGGGITQTVPVTLIIPSPSCTLAATTPKLILSAGQTGTVQAACTAMISTFSSPLKLSLTGVPSGVTVLTAATMAGGGTGSIQFATPITMGAGTFSLSLTATSGSFTETVPVTVTVNPSNFTLTASPSSVSIPAGGTGQFNATSTHSGLFDSAISLAWSGLPTGITAAIAKPSLAAPGDGAIATTFTVASSVAPGAYTATLTGSGGGDTQTLELTITVTAPSCTLSVASPTLGIYNGQTGTVAASCSALQGAFATPLSYVVKGAPSGVTAQYASGNIQVVAPPTMSPATFTLTLTAISGSFSKSATVAVTVSASNFVVTPSTASVTLQSGAASTLSLTSTHKGTFNSAVALAWSGLPTGVTAALSVPTLAAPGDGTITTIFSATSAAAPGTYTATLTATGGGITQTATVTLTVIVPPSFTLAAPGIALNAGQSGTSQVTVTPQGTFSGTVALSITGAPTGVTAKLASASVTAGKTVVLTVGAASTAATNSVVSFNLTLTGTSSSLTKQASIPITVSPNTFTLTAAQTALTVKVGTTGQVNAATTWLGTFDSAVNTSFTKVPAGITAASPAVSVTSNSFQNVIKFMIGSTVKPGNYTITWTGTGGGITQNLPFTVTVTD